MSVQKNKATHLDFQSLIAVAQYLNMEIVSEGTNNVEIIIQNIDKLLDIVFMTNDMPNNSMSFRLLLNLHKGE